MEVSLSSSEQVVLRVAPVDANGNAREVQNIVWAIESGSGSLEVAEDNLSAVYVPADNEVDDFAVIRVTADADLTEAGNVEITDTFDITVTGVVAQATDLGLSADAPTPKA